MYYNQVNSDKECSNTFHIPICFVAHYMGLSILALDKLELESCVLLKELHTDEAKEIRDNMISNVHELFKFRRNDNDSFFGFDVALGKEKRGKYYIIDLCRLCPSLYLAKEDVYIHQIRMEFYNNYIAHNDDWRIGVDDVQDYHHQKGQPDEKIEQRYKQLDQAYKELVGTFVETLYDDMKQGKRFLSYVNYFENSYLCQLLHEKGIKFHSLQTLYQENFGSSAGGFDEDYAAFRESIKLPLKVEICARFIKNRIREIMSNFKCDDEYAKKYSCFSRSEREMIFQKPNYVAAIKRFFVKSVRILKLIDQFEINVDTKSECLLRFNLGQENMIMKRLLELLEISIVGNKGFDLSKASIEFIVKVKKPWLYYLNYAETVKDKGSKDPANKYQLYLLAHKAFNKANLINMQRKESLKSWAEVLLYMAKEDTVDKYVNFIFSFYRF